MPSASDNLLTLASFLESTPPGSLAIAVCETSRIAVAIGRLTRPPVMLHCSEQWCDGPRVFRCNEDPLDLFLDKYRNAFIGYTCSNCGLSSRTFAVQLRLIDFDKCECIKYGEMPNFGPPTPSKLISLVGPDRELFLKGRRCETQGLGIAAFTYYRRVIENQRNRIFDNIIGVAKNTGNHAEAIAILGAAKKETQFSKSIAMAKSAIFPSLLINGHNPMALLHSALSKGVHELDDGECLAMAESVRVLLGELSEKLSQVFKDEREINLALQRLQQTKVKSPDP